MTLHLTITNQTKPTAVADMRWLKQHLLKTLKLLRIQTAEWSITIVNDKEMTALHARTMNLPTTTDVLTFDLRDDASITKEGIEVELDTVLCLDEAKRRAKELNHPLRQELLLYAIHSLLHVQGYDDRKKSDAAQMHRREDTLLIALGVGPVYGNKNSKGIRK
jgi:probable rRNA maturation factor